MSIYQMGDDVQGCGRDDEAWGVSYIDFGLLRGPFFSTAVLRLAENTVPLCGRAF